MIKGLQGVTGITVGGGNTHSVRTTRAGKNKIRTYSNFSERI